MTRHSFQSLQLLDAHELDRILRTGFPVDLAALSGHEYRGLNCHAPPGFLRYCRKFKKVFAPGPSQGLLRGWNLKIRQDGDPERWVVDHSRDHRLPGIRDPLGTAFWWLGGLRGADPVIGHFGVYPTPAGDRYAPSRGSAVIDYWMGKHPAGDVSALLRDYTVAVNEGNSDLLLGQAHLDLKVRVLPLRGYFIMEKDGPLIGAPAF